MFLLFLLFVIFFVCAIYFCINADFVIDSSAGGVGTEINRWTELIWKILISPKVWVALRQSDVIPVEKNVR